MISGFFTYSLLVLLGSFLGNVLQLATLKGQWADSEHPRSTKVTRHCTQGQVLKEESITIDIYRHLSTILDIYAIQCQTVTAKCIELHRYQECKPRPVFLRLQPGASDAPETTERSPIGVQFPSHLQKKGTLQLDMIPMVELDGARLLLFIITFCARSSSALTLEIRIPEDPEDPAPLKLGLYGIPPHGHQIMI